MRLAKWYNLFLDILVGGLLIFIVTLALLQIGARYIFGGAFTWSEEGNLFLWAWMILLASIRAEHMRVDFVVKYFPRTARKIIIVLIGLISLFLLALLFWGGMEMIKLTQSDFYITLPWISVKWLFVALLISAVLWAVTIITDTIQALRAQTIREL